MLVMGVGGFAVFYWLLENGYGEDQARNLLLLLFVLFENFQAFNSRSERHSAFKQRFFTNRLLVLSVIGAQVLHVGAMHLPALSETLRVTPVTIAEWGVLFLIASMLFVVMELEKMWDRRKGTRVVGQKR